MHMAKIKKTILDGTEPFKGVVVASKNYYAAHSFGQDGYDEGLFEGYVVVPVDVAIEKPAGLKEVFSAARAVGIEVDPSEHNPNALLTDKRIVDVLAGQGFDGYVGYEVIGNADYPVRIAWDYSKVTVHPEPSDKEDFTLVEGDRGGLLLKVETVRGRTLVAKAMESDDRPARESDITLLARVRALPGFRVDEEGAIFDREGREFQAESFLLWKLIESGSIGLDEIVRAPTP